MNHYQKPLIEVAEIELESSVLKLSVNTGGLEGEGEQEDIG